MAVAPQRIGPVVALILTLAAPAARAQDSVRTNPAPLPSVPVITGRDIARTGLLILGAAAVSPFDERIARASQRPALQGIAPLRNAARALNFAAGPGLIVVPIGVWAVGRLAGDAPIATTAVRTGEAVAVGAGMTWLAKGVIGRARPYVVADTDATRFRPGRGFMGGDYAALPSGHATAAWAAATILDTELRRYWPHGARVGVPVAYAGAVLVSLARVYTDKHWTSDVIAGAAVGTLAGRMVVHYTAAHPRNLLDRTLLANGAAGLRGVPVTIVSLAW